MLKKQITISAPKAPRKQKIIQAATGIQLTTNKLYQLYTDLYNTLDAPEFRKAQLLHILSNLVKLVENPKIMELELNVLEKTNVDIFNALQLFSEHRKDFLMDVFGSTRPKPGHPGYDLCEDFARLATEKGIISITGGAPGIMEAANKGSGQYSIGLGIKLPFEPELNKYVKDSPFAMEFALFLTRKLMFLMHAKAIAAFPGGVGTNDELFEVLTLIQTGKTPIVPVLLISPEEDEYWYKFDEYIKVMLKHQYISPNDIHLYRIVHSADEAVQHLLDFYKVYHSSRFWSNNHLLFRIKQEPTEIQLKDLNAILRDAGHTAEQKLKIVKQPGFDRDNSEYKDFYYLSTNFRPVDFATFRLIIDAINRWPALDNDDI